MKAWLAGVVLLMACSACTQGTPSSLSAGAASGNPLTPTEIRVPINISTHMVGEFETPPHDTEAHGTAIFILSPDGQSMTYRLVANNITNVFASHIHHGVPGVRGPIVVPLYSGPVAGGLHNGLLASGTITADNLTGELRGHALSDLVALIQNGQAYVNLHTNDGVDPPDTGPGDFPLGEVRGQL